MNYLNKAVKIAVMAHSGQLDKGGEPYIFHPFRVALNCETLDEKIVAMLHDTVEDTEITIEYLVDEGFSRDITEAVDSLTRRSGEDYMDFIRRISENRLAATVKLHDLADNMDESRLKGKKFWKLGLYRQAYDFLSAKILHGKNQELR